MAITKVPAPRKTREAPPILDGSHTPNLEKSPPLETETLNFKITAEFKREYKGYAVSRDMTMMELLRQSFELYKERHGR